MFKKQGYGYDKYDRLSEMASWREKAEKKSKALKKKYAVSNNEAVNFFTGKGDVGKKIVK